MLPSHQMTVRLSFQYDVYPLDYLCSFIFSQINALSVEKNLKWIKRHVFVVGTYSSDGSLKENFEHTSPPLLQRLNGGGVSRHSSDDTTLKMEDATMVAANLKKAAVAVDFDSDSCSALFSGHQCQWPGCGQDCSGPVAWRHHMAADHAPGDQTRAQARGQMQVRNKTVL